MTVALLAPGPWSSHRTESRFGTTTGGRVRAYISKGGSSAAKRTMAWWKNESSGCAAHPPDVLLAANALACHGSVVSVHTTSEIQLEQMTQHRCVSPYRTQICQWFGTVYCLVCNLAVLEPLNASHVSMHKLPVGTHTVLNPPKKTTVRLGTQQRLTRSHLRQLCRGVKKTNSQPGSIKYPWNSHGSGKSPGLVEEHGLPFGISAPCHPLPC